MICFAGASVTQWKVIDGARMPFIKESRAMSNHHSSNPAFREGAFRTIIGSSSGGAMTAAGTYNRTGFLLALAIGAAAFSWICPFADVQSLGTKMAIFMVAAVILAFVTIFKKEWSPYTAPAYAVAEGLVLGSLSRLFNMVYPGIVMQAVALTFGIFAGMLCLYRFRIIQVTDKLRVGICAATMGVLAVYLISMLMHWITGAGLGFISQATPFGIIFSIAVVIIATMNLLLDFDFIDQVSYYGAPKYMEWYAAFGLVMTLVWLYVEILHLLAKLRRD
jgi:uncharacterized YccA/Bax inhibitor family protein